MGKQRRRTKGEANEGHSDLKRFRRAMRTLDLVDSRLELEPWAQQVSRFVGEAEVDRWFEVSSTDIDRIYDFSYSSFERAMHFSVGWRSWPLTAECEWMLPRLRDALNRSDGDEPFLVEIGAGAGAAAALISAALKVPVIAMDVHPSTLGLAEKFADRTGGRVESHVASVGDLQTVLQGRSPTAVFGMTVFRHVQPHYHQKSSFSDWSHMQRLLATHRVGPEATRFIEAIAGADLVLAERTCPDYLAEVAAGLLAHGYDIPKGGVTRIDGALPTGPTTAFGFHFTRAELPQRNPNLLIEMFSPLPQPHAARQVEGYAAEALRLSLEPTTMIDSVQIDYTDGSSRMRREVFEWGDRMAGQYVSATTGFRHLHIFPTLHVDAALEHVQADEAELVANGQAKVRSCGLPASQWGSAFDT